VFEKGRLAEASGLRFLPGEGTRRRRCVQPLSDGGRKGMASLAQVNAASAVVVARGCQRIWLGLRCRGCGKCQEFATTRGHLDGRARTRRVSAVGLKAEEKRTMHTDGGTDGCIRK
jgi:hypothetical protein